MTTKLDAITHQPKPFYLIFFLELWERFGYYGVQVLIVLYMVRNLGYSDSHADFLFAAFSALVFLLPCMGGYIGDKILGTKRTILLGAFILASGYFLLALPNMPANFLVFPLAVIAVGNGLFKANPSSLLSKVYQESEQNQDSGFTLYYMAINIGAFFSMNLTPVLNSYFGWHVAFSVCCVGLVLAILSYLVMRHTVEKIGSAPDKLPLQLNRFIAVVLLSLVAIGVSYWLLMHYTVVTWILTIGTIGLLIYYLFLTSTAEPHERKGMFLFIILFLQAIIFFILYFQMPTSLTLFALRNVEHSILGIPIRAAQFQMLDPFWIMIMSPVLAVIYHALASRKKDLSIPSKFSLGTLLAGLAFLVIPLGGLFNHGGIISGIWLVISYWFQGTGELLVSALGLSLAARYVPERFMGFTMGLWFLSTSIASIVAGKVASFADIPHNISTDPMLSFPIYNNLFLKIGITTLVVALIMFAFVPMLKKLIDDKETVVDVGLFEDQGILQDELSEGQS